MDAGLLVIRIVVGLVMAYHGTEKLFGWWGGEGIAGAADFFGRQGYRPPRLMAAVAGLTETAGGLSLATGFLTPLGVAALVGTFVNILVLHLPNGLARRKNGFEYELVLLAATCGTGLAGPGSFALDRLLGLDFAPVWGIAAVGVGVLSGLGVTATRKAVT
ncbi:DoxX family protein [Actinocrispum wychmicini]|uniref:Putative oxidoreductase n=1 Tax=Actinocrispum wychmicini TaxID=1213861 RepID=A0A4R2JZM6_9PSEU|nr:DoxX family protein [Actinocrispum wychmicini]TCO62759.1 putative oxidoreductase [Actinocrispum wychmicini]